MQIPITHPEKIVSPTFENVSHLKFGSVFSNHMFLSEYENNEWTKMRIVPFQHMSVSPSISALHYGQAVFEGMKIAKKDGKIFLFRVRDHARRLNASLERMAMPTISEDTFVHVIEEYVKTEAEFIPDIEGVALYVRPFVFAKDSTLEMKPSSEYTWSIISFLTTPYYGKTLRLKIENEYVRASRGGVGSIKTAGNYGASMYPTAKAQKEGFDQVIWTDPTEHKYIEESGIMNIGFILDKKIVTPKLTDSILPGITRDSILTLARLDNVVVEERLITTEEVCNGIKDGSITEAFGMGTAVGISPIHSITHKGIEYALPAQIDNSTIELLSKKLKGIKQGLIEDTQGWIQIINI